MREKGRPNIRIRSKDRILLNDLKKKVRRKELRIKRIYGYNLNVSYLDIEQITSRQEFNAYVSYLQNIHNRNSYNFYKNKYGVVFTKQEVMDYRKIVRDINQSRKNLWNKIKDKPYIVNGKESAMTIGDRIKIAPRKYYFGDVSSSLKYVRSRKEFEKLKQKRRKEAHFSKNKKYDEIFQENFISALHKVFGKDSEIEKIAKELSLDQFMMLYYSYSDWDIDFLYSSFTKNMKYNNLIDILKNVQSETL